MDFNKPEPEKLTNVLIVPFALAQHFLHPNPKIVTDALVKKDELLLVDGEGKVHYFKYLGKNLHFGESE